MKTATKTSKIVKFAKGQAANSDAKVSKPIKKVEGKDNTGLKFFPSSKSIKEGKSKRSRYFRWVRDYKPTYKPQEVAVSKILEGKATYFAKGLSTKVLHDLRKTNSSYNSLRIEEVYVKVDGKKNLGVKAIKIFRVR